MKLAEEAKDMFEDLKDSEGIEKAEPLASETKFNNIDDNNSINNSSSSSNNNNSGTITNDNKQYTNN